MPEPFDYTSQLANVPSPQAAFMSGFKDMNEIQNARRALDLQEQMQNDLGAVSINPTIGGINQLMVKYPQLADKFKPVLENMTEQQKNARIRQANDIFMPLLQGDRETAINQMKMQEEAAKNSGDQASANSLSMMRKLVESTETGKAGDNLVLTSVGSFLAAAMGDKQFANTYEALGKEQRARGEAPVKGLEEKNKLTAERGDQQLQVLLAARDAIKANPENADQIKADTIASLKRNADAFKDVLGPDPINGAVKPESLSGAALDNLINLNTSMKNRAELKKGTNWEGFHGAIGPNGQPGVFQYSQEGGVRQVPGLKPLPPATLMGGSAVPAAPGGANLYAERLVKGLEEWPSTVSIRTDPTIKEGIQIARQMDPSFNASTHKQRQQVQKAFTTGKQADAINALNTGMGHLSELSDLAEQLNNKGFTTYNTVKNWMAKNTGDPTVTAFETTKKAVADEVTRVWRGTGGSEQDVQQALANLSESLSPAQLRGNIYQLTKLMASKQKALEDQYKKGMGRFGDIEILDPEAQSALDKITARAKGKSVSSQPAKSQPAGATSVDELMRLLGK